MQSFGKKMQTKILKFLLTKSVIRKLTTVKATARSGP